MRVRETYTGKNVTICRKHYQDPPEPWAGTLGAVQDSRNANGPCDVCDSQILAIAREMKARGELTSDMDVYGVVARRAGVSDDDAMGALYDHVINGTL